MIFVDNHYFFVYTNIKKDGEPMANRIPELRKSKGVNQTELAEILGVKQNTVSSWETGRTEPDHQTLCRMADYFHVPIDFILCRNEKSPDAAAATPGEREEIRLEEVRALLAELGLLADGRELTEQDVALVLHVIGILDAHFGQ